MGVCRVRISLAHFLFIRILTRHPDTLNSLMSVKLFDPRYMTPLISLVITVYNRERYLSAAIESVLNQTFSDFELLVWDDGSSDRSVAIARSYAQQDKRVRVVAAPHTGRGQALSDAITHTTCKYLGWEEAR